MLSPVRIVGFPHVFKMRLRFIGVIKKFLLMEQQHKQQSPTNDN